MSGSASRGGSGTPQLGVDAATAMQVRFLRSQRQGVSPMQLR